MTHLLPNSQRTTNRARAFNWLKYLSRNHQIFLVSFIDSVEETRYISELRKYCYKVITVLRKPKNRLLYRFINLFQNVPYFIIKEYNCSEMHKELRSILKNNTFDIIHVYSLAMAHYVVDIQGINKILDAGDSLTRNYLQQWRSSIALGRRILSFVDWYKMKRYEPQIFSKFDKCILLNPVDKKFMAEFYPELPVEVITIGADLEYFRPQENRKEFPSLIFTGTMSYIPNSDAMEYFCHKILPLIEKRYPGIRLYILGGGISYKLRKMTSIKKNIIIAGFVKDIRKFVGQSTVFICPLRMGTGIKTKILEAMAMGKAIVSTPIGVEGIGVAAERDVLVTDTTEQFANAVIYLLENKQVRVTMAENVRKIVERENNFELLTSKLENIYREAIKQL